MGFWDQTNGAGKTTTLRMLLGLIKPTSGTATVLGKKPGAPSGLARVGALVESPAFYPHLSGRDNLIGMARLSGVDNPADRVEEALRNGGELASSLGQTPQAFSSPAPVDPTQAAFVLGCYILVLLLITALLLH